MPPPARLWLVVRITPALAAFHHHLDGDITEVRVRHRSDLFVVLRRSLNGVDLLEVTRADTHQLDGDLLGLGLLMRTFDPVRFVVFLLLPLELQILPANLPQERVPGYTRVAVG